MIQYKHIKDPDEIEIATAVRVIRAAFAPVARRFCLTHENCPGNGAFLTEERLKRILARDARLFALYVGEEATGYVIAKRKDAEIWYLEKLGVLPEYTRRGFGSLLMEHAQAHIRKEGGRRIHIGIIGLYGELQQWYEKRGFYVTGIKEFSTLPFPVCYMEKYLE